MSFPHEGAASHDDWWKTTLVEKSAGESDYSSFGPFILDLKRRAIWRDGDVIAMPPKVFDLICYLALRAGEVATKDELVDAVWQGAVVADSNIGQHIHLAREALEDLAKPHAYIKTVHGRGFRFAVELRALERGPIAETPSTELRRLTSVELCNNAVYFARMGTPAALASSAELARQAARIDPNWSEPHAQMAWCAILEALFGYGRPPERYRVAAWHAAEALRRGRQCARAHAVLAAVSLLRAHDAQGAHKHLDAASGAHVDLPELHALRLVAYVVAGAHERAIFAAGDAMSWFPGNTMIGTYAAFSLYHAGRLIEAEEQLQQLLALRPGAAFATLLLGFVRLTREQFAAAREAFETLLFGRPTMLHQYVKFRAQAIAGLSYVEAREGNEAGAAALREDLQRLEYASPVAVALAYTGAANYARAAKALEDAFSLRDPSCPFVKSDPLFALYRRQLLDAG